VIFVDTSAWIALYLPNDFHGAAAKSFVSGVAEPLMTTDYVLDEFLTHLKVRGYHRRAIPVAKAILENQIATLEWVQEADVIRGLLVFEQYQDKGWSFTDCTSRVVMERLGIQTAFAFDDHFRQFGEVDVLPPIID
jgi:predicted nucleic acid-binding protein